MIFLNEQNFANGFWAHLMIICCDQHFSLMKHGIINAVKYRERILTPFFNELYDDELIFGYLQ
ncbi:hypothetical protein BDFB_007465 [Asbolus verrucosus]|uniref:Uncharacterized protein n=1 Tax=Asbolus verrucosus TaxID=1661398 RepID=A0A482VIS1_ASBVE|nr:hypothetical protein BDFB_007465 [Asbolus verrucosus]